MMLRKTIFLTLALCAAAAGAAVIRDIPYAPENGRFGLGDLYLPESPSSATPVVLTIHGGGWTAGDRYSWSGVAEFFCRDLGCVAFNIEYRLASAANRWPACGDDCVKAANWLFSDAFRERTGFLPKSIYICGGSAGGHLALWTFVNLPSEKVAGCISISSIGDPLPDYNVHRSRYVNLFGDDVSESDLSAMNPILRIRGGMAPVLCTHALTDTTVPIQSHQAFTNSFHAAGNDCTFFAYPSTIRDGLDGHCIWLPGSSPHRLLPEIETMIARFMGRGEKDAYGNEIVRENGTVVYRYWVDGAVQEQATTTGNSTTNLLRQSGLEARCRTMLSSLGQIVTSAWHDGLIMIFR